jgi:hypothetical protein
MKPLIAAAFLITALLAFHTSANALKPKAMDEITASIGHVPEHAIFSHYLTGRFARTHMRSVYAALSGDTLYVITQMRNNRLATLQCSDFSDLQTSYKGRNGAEVTVVTDERLFRLSFSRKNGGQEFMTALRDCAAST